MKVLVIGASLKPERYSNQAICLLKQMDYQVYGYGLKPGQICSVDIDTELKQYKNVDTVSLYINAKRQEDFYAYIVSLHPRRVIFNPGTENPEFYEILQENKIHYEIACTLVLLRTGQF
ncbi:CoA-binding protein [Myroides sp. LJL119]